jgi:hypothetical protein
MYVLRFSAQRYTRSIQLIMNAFAATYTGAKDRIH